MASAHGGGDRGQQGVEVPLAAHEPCDLEQAGEPGDGVRSVLGKSHQQVDRPPPIPTEAPLDAPRGPLALSVNGRTARAPRGHRRLVVGGPVPVGAYAEKLRDELRKRARVQLFGEVFGLRVGRASVWFELRDAEGRGCRARCGATPSSELRLPAGAVA